MISLNKFVMIKFGEDQAVIPSSSPVCDKIIKIYKFYIKILI